MGWDRKSIEIVGHVSRHNSPRDERDDALWADLVRRVREIADDPQYADLNILTSGHDE